MAGFFKDRLFYTQGDYGLFQCATTCHHKTYDSKEMNSKMHSISLSINNSYVPEKIKSKYFMIAEDLAKVIETM